MCAWAQPPVQRLRRALCAGGANSFLRQAGRFLCVGGTATLVDAALFYGLLRLAGGHESVCFTLAFIITTACRFVVDKYFTFRERNRESGRAALRQFVVYALCCTITLVLGLMVFRLGLGLGLPPLWSKVVSIPPVTVSGFVLFRYAAFRAATGA